MEGTNPRIDPDLPDWIEDPLRRYLDTNGVDHHIWNGVPTAATDREIPVVVLERV